MSSAVPFVRPIAPPPPAPVVARLRRHWRLLVAVPAVAAVVGATVLFLRPNYYTSHASFIPASRSGGSLGGLAELAAAAGVGGAVQANPSSPQFYQQLLVSTPIVHGVLRQRFAAPARGYDLASRDSVPLYHLLGDEDAPDAERLADAHGRLLERHLATGLDRRTGIVSLDVTLNDPALAAAVGAEFIRQVEVFNRTTLQTQARARRVFTQARAEEAGQALAEAQQRTRAFLVGNRDYQLSPALAFEYERLQQQVTLNQELYLQLRRELDAARIREVDDTPTITVLEPPLPPVKKSGPRRLVTLVAIVLLAAMGTAAAIVAADVRDRLRGLMAGDA